MAKAKKPTKAKTKRKSNAGRKRKFTDVQILEQKIQAYFDSCFRTLTKRVIKEDLVEEYRGKPLREIPEEAWEEVVITDPDTGEPKKYQAEPFTISGLALALDTNRQTLLYYESGEYDEDDAEFKDVKKLRKFSDTIKRAKLIIENYTEKELFRDKNVTGVIFNLKNNYGYKDKTEIDHTTKGDKIGTVVYLPKHNDGKSSSATTGKKAK